MIVIFSPESNSSNWSRREEPPAAVPLIVSPSTIQPEQIENVFVKPKRLSYFYDIQ